MTSTRRVSVIDYGIGNISSVANSLTRVGVTPLIAENGKELLQQAASHIVLPGVGAIGRAMELLREREILAALEKRVVGAATSYLGICVGMQVLAEHGEEFGSHTCLGWIPGVARRLAKEGDSVRLPHVGWNTVHPTANDPLFSGLADAHFYFVHSYYVDCSASIAIAHSTYHRPFVSSIRKDNITGVQFHPEKSGPAGETLLKNFFGL